MTHLGYVLTEDCEVLRQLDEAAAILVALTCVLEDHYRDAFDAALADLLRVSKGNLFANLRVRSHVSSELNRPHDPQWKVSAAEYEKRKRQIFQALRAQTNEAVTPPMIISQTSD